MPGVPHNYAGAAASPSRIQWQRAMSDEWDAFESHNVSIPSKLPYTMLTLGTTCLFTFETNADGSAKHKARPVAQGLAQRPGTDVTETFAPVAGKVDSADMLKLVGLMDGTMQALGKWHRAPNSLMTK